MQVKLSAFLGLEVLKLSEVISNGDDNFQKYKMISLRKEN